MAAGKGTAHHRLHGITGFITIITLPIVLYKLIGAIPKGADGFRDWLSAPIGAVSLLFFMSAALWYCKLEFDEVIMDYTDGGLKSFGLMANRVVALLAWATAAYAILKIWLG